MTRRAHKPMDKSLRRAIARLMHLHQQTHPDRLARRFGISAWYVRKLWGETVEADLPPLGEALEALKSAPPVGPAQSSKAGPGAVQAA